MFNTVLKKIIGSKNDREIKSLRTKVDAINALEPEMQKLSDAQLQAKTAEFRTQLEQGKPLDDLLVTAFAVCREAGKRALGMRHFDVQLMGGMTLHSGKIAEMKTGEGKTLVATLACYLNALSGKGVHVVTVNDYLAKRDAEWMGRLYGFLGLSTGVVVHSQADADKKRAYRCDITYGQNNEFGFDYLRDNMKFSSFDYAQRPLNFAIVDEVDSILIDEARTPLIISGPGDTASDKYLRIDEVIPRLRKDEHYAVDEKNHSVTLTEDGMEAAQQLLHSKGLTTVENLYDPVNLETLHILQQCLKAHTLYKRDQQYMVSESGQVLIIDEFTGRVLPGRRWSDGLHQAVEAKERVAIQEENITLATISFQNLFRLYNKLAGMTGTADTEASEFHKIYKLEVVSIPTHRPVQRQDFEDLIYKSERSKFKAVVEEIKTCQTKGQPVLVGTTSVEKSDALSRMLTRENIAHEVLNAKQHEREAYVVAQAGRKSAVTVATNMAGRGTDILLGGNAEMLARYHVMATAPEELRADKDALEKAIEEKSTEFKTTCEIEKKEVLAAGGLHILGTERHESRRIDNQLRGRGGRQGDPGTSRFYLSLEDDLMRIFGGERLQAMMTRMGMEDDVPIEHPWVSKSVQNAQKKVEERNFDIRKHLLEYDDVMNQQRKTVYALRRQLLEGQYKVLRAGTGGDRDPIYDDVVESADEDLTQSSSEIVDAMVRHYEDTASKQGVDLHQALPPEALSALEHDAYMTFGARLPEAQAGTWKWSELQKAWKEAAALSLTEQRERMLDLVDEVASTQIDQFCPKGRQPDQWDFDGLKQAYKETFGIDASGIESIGDRQALAEKLYKDAENVLLKKTSDFGSDQFLRLFRNFYLQEIDRQWVQHLQNMEHLRDGIGLRGYGQRDPKKEYKREGYELFVQMIASVKKTVVFNMHHVEKLGEEDVARLESQRESQIRAMQERIRMSHPDAEGAGEADDAAEGAQVVQGRTRRAMTSGLPTRQQPMVPVAPIVRERPKTGRNEPCWCGSGKKYKNCHWQADQATPATSG